MTLVGWTALERPLTFDLYRRWLDAGLHGEMSYLETQAPIKEAPQTRFPLARSCVIFAVNYIPHPAPRPIPLRVSRRAAYAQGDDYHHWLKTRLEAIAKELRESHPEHQFECHTDSSPLLERDLAARAGLGWFGKNTCLINREQGSLFLLGEILSSLPPPETSPGVPDFCGTCRRCLDICPTGALTEPRQLDARRCLSYWSIESRAVPPEEIRENWGDWLFGCDLCQTVCPWNEKAFGRGAFDNSKVRSLDDTASVAQEEELRWLLTASGKAIERAIHGTALRRAGPFGLRRNALIVVANRRITNLSKEVQQWTTDPRLGDLAAWTLNKLINPSPASS